MTILIVLSDVDGINQFTEDFEDMVGARNDSARARRRAGYSPRVGLFLVYLILLELNSA